MAQTRRLRWQVIVVTLCVPLGTLALLAGLTKGILMFSTYWQLGLIPPHPSTPSFNEVAVTPQNVWDVVVYLGEGVMWWVVVVLAWRSMKRARGATLPPVNEASENSTEGEAGRDIG